MAAITPVAENHLTSSTSPAFEAMSGPVIVAASDAPDCRTAACSRENAFRSSESNGCGAGRTGIPLNLVRRLDRPKQQRRAQMAAARSGSVVASSSTRGVICQGSPYLSLHHPHSLSVPP